MTRIKKIVYTESLIKEIKDARAIDIANSLAIKYTLPLTELIFESNDDYCKVSLNGLKDSNPIIEIKRLKDDKFDIRTNLHAIHNYHLSVLTLEKMIL